MIVICTLTLLIAVGVYATRDINILQWGQKTAQNEENLNMQNEAVAEVNGQKISKSKFENYKAGLDQASGSFTDEEIIEKLIRQEVMLQEIQKRGYTVTDAEVTEFNNERFDLLESDPEAYQIVKDYIDGVGITMDEYKEQSKEISKTALLANKFRDDLITEYKELNPEVLTQSAQKQNQVFEDYLKQYIDDLCDAANITVMP